MARPSGLKGRLAGLSAKAAEQLVLKGYPLTGQAVKLPGKARRFPADMDAQPRGGGKGVSLDMVNGQHIARELIGPLGIFIGGITPSVNPNKQLPQIC